MHQNKKRINSILGSIQERILLEPTVDLRQMQSIKEDYITFLLHKNLRKTISNEKINYYNYFSYLDSI